MCWHLFLCLWLLLIPSSVTQDVQTDRPLAATAVTTVQSGDVFTGRTEVRTLTTELKVIMDLETVLPTGFAETMPSESMGSTTAPFLNMDTVTITKNGETFVTDIDNISSTELVTKMRTLCCSEGFLDIEGNCYRFEDDRATFDEALHRCNFSSGGSLAKIEPIEPTTQYLLDITRYFSESDLTWIGLLRSRENSNDKFTWTFDETTLNISNWAVDQPASDNTANCGTMSSNGTWFLRPCDETIPYICQSPPVFCAELTTAPEVTTEEFTTEERTEIITNATTTTRATTTLSTTPAATTNRSTTASTTTTKTLMTTKLTRKPPLETTTDEDDEVTTEMMTEDETTPTKSTTPTPSSSTTNTTISPEPTASGNTTSNETFSQPPGSTGGNRTMASQRTSSQVTTPTTPTSSVLSTINKILIAIIVIFVVLAIIIGCMMIYLIYKRKKGTQAVYNVKDVEIELEDIKSVEDLSRPSTSSGSGVANTSFVSNDDMPEFSGAHFSGLKGKSFSLDHT